MDKETRNRFNEEMQQFLNEYIQAYSVKQDVEAQISKLHQRPYEPLSTFLLHQLHQELAQWEEEWGIGGNRIQEIGEKYWPEQRVSVDTFTEAEMDDMHARHLQAQADSLLHQTSTIEEQDMEHREYPDDNFERSIQAQIQEYIDNQKNEAEDRARFLSVIGGFIKSELHEAPTPLETEFEQNLKAVQEKSNQPKPRPG